MATFSAERHGRRGLELADQLARSRVAARGSAPAGLVAVAVGRHPAPCRPCISLHWLGTIRAKVGQGVGGEVGVQLVEADDAARRGAGRSAPTAKFMKPECLEA